MISLFVLGRDPELSLLEIESYLKSNNMNYKILDYNKDVVAVELENLNFKKAISDLAGTIKIAQVFSEDTNLSKIENNFNKLNLNQKRIDYSISYYDTELYDFARETLKDLCKRGRIKAIYRKPKRKTDRFLTPTELIDKKILENGIDIVIFKNFIAKTVAIFNPNDYKIRDLNRPKKDFLKSISLRLARLLINISQVKENQLLLDPFCGTGTILQEALLKNINVIGVDKDERSAKDSLENIKWLRNNYAIKAKSNIINGDASSLTKIIKNKVDVIVTEPYMGPFIKNQLTNEEASRIIRQLTGLYAGFLEEAEKILDKNGKIVIIMPEINNQTINPLILNSNFKAYKTALNIRLPVLYMLKESKIRRYIYVLELKERFI